MNILAQVKTLNMPGPFQYHDEDLPRPLPALIVSFLGLAPEHKCRGFAACSQNSHALWRGSVLELSRVMFRNLISMMRRERDYRESIKQTHREHYLVLLACADEMRYIAGMEVLGKLLCLDER